ncbi:hypothetical protein [Pukyongiella litopenaei]|uniref:Uncharacterized protein n=1 Tax=Pukyongiella litopenaei TaxID=2605946 RepID=A0A2S0MSP5_9RHOB|nr:hypothetical protein [Pukyongiella litopenaei]AVO38910.2 hypothetical protein C6Y53_15170 [Pukyongiella litopenaei]
MDRNGENGGAERTEPAERGFALREFDALKEEIARKDADIESMKRRVQLVTFVTLILIYIGVLPWPGAGQIPIALRAEVAFSLALGSLAFAVVTYLDASFVGRHIRLMGNYIRSLEIYLYRVSGASPMGWERFLRSRKSNDGLKAWNESLDAGGDCGQAGERGSNKSSWPEYFRRHAFFLLFVLINLAMVAHRAWDCHMTGDCFSFVTGTAEAAVPAPAEPGPASDQP